MLQVWRTLSLVELVWIAVVVYGLASHLRRLKVILTRRNELGRLGQNGESLDWLLTMRKKEIKRIVAKSLMVLVGLWAASQPEPIHGCAKPLANAIAGSVFIAFALLLDSESRDDEKMWKRFGII